jgi:uncharacterized protein (TIRG00374 family)
MIEEDRMNAQSSKHFRFVLSVVVSLLALFLALRHVDFRSAAAAFSSAHMWWVVAALGSVAINTWAKAMRWKSLMGEVGSGVPLKQAVSALLIGQMLNTIIPARVGDLSRAYLIGNLGPSKTFVLGTVVLEKLIDLLCYGLLFLLLVFLMPTPAWIGGSVYPVTLVAVVMLTSAVALAYRPSWAERVISRSLIWIPLRWTERVMERANSALASLQVLRRRESNLRLLGWSALVWLTALLTNYLVLRALRITAPLVAGLLLLIVLQAATTIPSVPGNIGVFEYMAILCLSIFAIERSLSFSYGVLLHIIVFLPTTLLGLFFFWNAGLSLWRPATAETAPRS